MSNYNDNTDAPTLELADISEDDYVRVEYNSAYSDKRQDFEGLVTSVTEHLRFTVDPSEDMADGEPRIYTIGLGQVAIDTGYGDRRISELCNADIHISHVEDADEDEEMDEFESAQALIHADEADVITLSYDSVNDAHGRQEKTVEVIEAPYRYDYESEDYEAAEVMAKDLDRDEETEHVYVRLYAYTDDTDGYVASGYEGHAETRHELDTIGAIRRLGSNLRVSSVESNVIAAGCLGCGFGYDHTEHDSCPTCHPEDAEDEDAPTIVTDGGSDMGSPHEPRSAYDGQADAVAFRSEDEIADLVDLSRNGDQLRINDRNSRLSVLDYYSTSEAERELRLLGNGTYYTLTVANGRDEVTLSWPSGSETVESLRITNRNAYNISTYENILTEEVEVAPWNFEWGQFENKLDADEATHAHRALRAMVIDYRNRFDLTDECHGEHFRDMLALRIKFDKWADENGMSVYGHEQGILGAALDYSRESPEVNAIFERLSVEETGEHPDRRLDGEDAYCGAPTLAEGELVECERAPEHDGEHAGHIPDEDTPGLSWEVHRWTPIGETTTDAEPRFVTDGGEDEDDDSNYGIVSCGPDTRISGVSLRGPHATDGGEDRDPNEVYSDAYIENHEHPEEHLKDRQWKDLTESEEQPKPLAEGETVVSERNVILGRLEGVHSEEFVVSTNGINSVAMDREEIGVLAELAGFEVTEL